MSGRGRGRGLLLDAHCRYWRAVPIDGGRAWERRPWRRDGRRRWRNWRRDGRRRWRNWRGRRPLCGGGRRRRGRDGARYSYRRRGRSGRARRGYDDCRGRWNGRRCGRVTTVAHRRRARSGVGRNRGARSDGLRACGRGDHWRRRRWSDRRGRRRCRLVGRGRPWRREHGLDGHRSLRARRGRHGRAGRRGRRGDRACRLRDRRE